MKRHLTLAAQAAALGLGRSTTWTVVSAKHKASGLSPSIIIQMLSAPRLPPTVRQKIYEYVKEKIDGSYGHKREQIRRFTAGLVIVMQVDVRRAVRKVERTLNHHPSGTTSL